MQREQTVAFPWHHKPFYIPDSYIYAKDTKKKNVLLRDHDNNSYAKAPERKVVYLVEFSRWFPSMIINFSSPTSFIGGHGLHGYGHNKCLEVDSMTV